MFLIVPRGKAYSFQAREIYPREYQRLVDFAKKEGKNSSPVSYNLQNLAFRGNSFLVGKVIIDIGEISSVPVIRIESSEQERIGELEKEIGFNF